MLTIKSDLNLKDGGVNVFSCYSQNSWNLSETKERSLNRIKDKSVLVDKNVLKKIFDSTSTFRLFFNECPTKAGQFV